MLKERPSNTNLSYSIHMESQNWLKERQKQAVERDQNQNNRKESILNQSLNSHFKLLAYSNKDNLFYKSTDRLNGRGIECLKLFIAKTRYRNKQNNMSQCSMLEDSKMFWNQTPTNIELKLRNLWDTLL